MKITIIIAALLVASGAHAQTGNSPPGQNGNIGLINGQGSGDSLSHNAVNFANGSPSAVGGNANGTVLGGNGVAGVNSNGSEGRGHK